MKCPIYYDRMFGQIMSNTYSREEDDMLLPETAKAYADAGNGSKVKG